MRKIIYIVLAVVLVGCQKETMNHPVSLDTVYNIVDNPDDPVQHERYLMYKEFNVAIFFNDTIGKVLLKYDNKGNPVYRTETLDLGWKFNGYTRADFNFTYITDPTAQLKFLNVIRSFVTEAGPKLTPFSILAVSSLNVTDRTTGSVVDSYSSGSFKNYFRTLMMTNGWKASTLPILNQLIMREMLKQKITNYKHPLGEFFEVSDKLWYGKGWLALDQTIEIPVDMATFTASPLYDDNYKWSTFYNTQYRRDSVSAYIRETTGRFGYVCGGEIGKSGGVIAPENTDNDLDGYVKAMLKNPGEEFHSLWGKSPLVMKKYQILRTVIHDNIGIDL